MSCEYTLLSCRYFHLAAKITRETALRSRLGFSRAPSRERLLYLKKKHCVCVLIDTDDADRNGRRGAERLCDVWTQDGVACCCICRVAAVVRGRRRWLCAHWPTTHDALKLTPAWKNGWKIKKLLKHAKRALFWMVGGENGAILTTHLFTYTSECTIS